MEIAILILRIILLILSGTSSCDAVSKVASESGVSFSTLWNMLDDKYK